MSVERKLKASFNFNTLFFVFCFFPLLFAEKKNRKKKTIEAKHYGGESWSILVRKRKTLYRKPFTSHKNTFDLL